VEGLVTSKKRQRKLERDRARRARREQAQAANPPAALPTTERLARELARAGAPQQMVVQALAGYYDDYKSPLAAPGVQLLADLREAGLPDLAERAIGGEFDATKEESDAWAKSEEGREAFAQLLGGGGVPAVDDPTAPGGEHYTLPTPIDLSGDDEDRDKGMIFAAVDLAHRTGATGFDFNHAETIDETPEGVRSARITWYVEGYYDGVRLIEQDHDTMSQAAWAFAIRVLHGGKCRCGKVASLDPRGVFVAQKGMLSGETWTVEQQRAAGICVWTLDRPGDHHWKWVGECGAGRDRS
jgi:hypothetical protein